MAKDYYGVFRNSVYNLTINKFSQIGDDVPGGYREEDDNSNIEEEDTYLEVKVTVNPWRLNAIDINF